MRIRFAVFHWSGWRSGALDITLWEIFITCCCTMFVVMLFIAIVKVGLKINEHLETRNRIRSIDYRFPEYLVEHRRTSYFIPIKWDSNNTKDYDYTTNYSSDNYENVYSTNHL